MRKLIYKIRLWLGKLWLRLHKGGVYYVTGTELLPPPLTQSEESEILEHLDESPVGRRTLVERNLRLVVYIAKKFENTGVPLEDLVSIGTIGMIKAANTFRPDKNIKLATYASRCIENEILMYIRKTGNSRYEISFDEPLNVDCDGNELLLSDVVGSDGDSVSRRLEDADEKKIIADAIEKLNAREREIVELRYGLYGKREYTQKEVADMLGISQSYISRLEKRIIERLRAEISGKL
ncbi:MAG: RNA polymerase sporulation sigma factor SigE [Clostridia bacterium]|nr:RNA polymerase sporulation sigma factor SigE [Clostridia bacterium]